VRLWEKGLFFTVNINSDMRKLVIRAATPDDIPSIVKVSLASTTEEEVQGFSAPEWVTFSSSEELSKVWVEANRLKDGFEVIVAEKNGEIVGLIVFKMEPDHGHIDNIDITEDEQRKGIGRALVEHVENIAKAKGLSLMKTDTTENIEGVPWKSYGFWIKMGYKNKGERLPTKWNFKTIPFDKRLE